MHQRFWSDDETRREAARKLEAKLGEAAAKKAAANACEDAVHPSYATHPPSSGESYVTRTSATTIKLINVLLDDWRYFADEINTLTREAHELHQIESGADIEF